MAVPTSSPKLAFNNEEFSSFFLPSPPIAAGSESAIAKKPAPTDVMDSDNKSLHEAPEALSLNTIILSTATTKTTLKTTEFQDVSQLAQVRERLASVDNPTESLCPSSADS